MSALRFIINRRPTDPGHARVLPMDPREQAILDQLRRQRAAGHPERKHS